MSDSLIVVESPTKVKTIKKILGKDFNVVASMGHIKDLPKKTLGIDLENNFEPTYQVIEAKKKTIEELKKAARSAQNIYLAPDPDREGEAIAWHIADIIGDKKKNIYQVLKMTIEETLLCISTSFNLEQLLNALEPTLCTPVLTITFLRLFTSPSVEAV